MGRRSYWVVFLFIFLVILQFSNVYSQTGDDEGKAYLIALNVKDPSQVKNVVTTQFDGKKVELSEEKDEQLFFLEDLTLGEDQMDDGPDCFMPEIKIVFRTETYIFSLYCTSMMRFKNSAPYKTGSQRLKNDFPITESVIEYLEEIKKKYLGNNFDAAVAARFVKPEKLDDLDTNVDDVDVINEKDDDDDDDKDLENDAVDREGWFDDTVDPGLEDNDEPNLDDDDDEDGK